MPNVVDRCDGSGRLSTWEEQGSSRGTNLFHHDTSTKALVNLQLDPCSIYNDGGPAVWRS